MSKAAGLTADVAASCPASTCHTAPPPAAGAGLNVLPGVAAASVGNCLSLMEAQEPFIVKAGCSRLQLLMRAEAARQRAVEQGAARKLLRLLQAPAADEGAGRQGWGGMPSNLATADCLRCNHGCGLLHAGPTSVLAWPLHPPTPALPPPLAALQVWLTMPWRRLRNWRAVKRGCCRYAMKAARWVHAGWLCFGYPSVRARPALSAQALFPQRLLPAGLIRASATFNIYFRLCWSRTWQACSAVLRPKTPSTVRSRCWRPLRLWATYRLLLAPVK